MSPQTCKHGTMKFREGTGSNGRQWKAYMCPTPKGTVDQCDPVWLDQYGEPKASGAKKAVVSTSNAEELAILREINNTLTMIFAHLKLRGSVQTENGTLNHPLRPVPMPPYEVPPTPMPPHPIYYAAPSLPNPLTVQGGAIPTTANMGEADINVEDIPF